MKFKKRKTVYKPPNLYKLLKELEKICEENITVEEKKNEALKLLRTIKKLLFKVWKLSLALGRRTEPKPDEDAPEPIIEVYSDCDTEHSEPDEDPRRRGQ